MGFDQHLQVGFGFESSPTPVERWCVSLHFSAGMRLLLALLAGSNEKGAEGLAVTVGVVSVLFLLGIGARKSPAQLATARDVGT
jgi:hypothetical protein